MDHVLKSMKNSSVKIKRKNLRKFHVQLLLQETTESYSIHCAGNDNTLAILMPFNSSGLVSAHNK